jgi:hypothetical protein
VRLWLSRTIPAEPPENLDLFLGCWLISGLLFFSAAATKQPNYIMPIVPAVILLAARWWQRSFGPDGSGDKRPAVMLALTGLIGLFTAAALFATGHLLTTAVEQARPLINPDSFEYAFPSDRIDLGVGPPAAGFFMAGAILVGLYAGWRRLNHLCLAALTAAAVIFIAGIWLCIIPQTMDYLQTPARRLAFFVRTNMAAGSRLAAFGLYKPTLWFYTGHYIERVRTQQQAELDRLLETHPHVFLLSRKSLLPVLSARPRFNLIRTEGGYILGDNQAQPRSAPEN